MSQDGGPAFPIANAVFDADAPDAFEQFKAATSQSQGMSLRDYFAAAALPAFLSHEWMGESAKQFEDPKNQIEEFRAFIAHKAYLYADAMLAEREKS